MSHHSLDFRWPLVRIDPLKLVEQVARNHRIWSYTTNILRGDSEFFEREFWAASPALPCFKSIGGSSRILTATLVTLALVAVANLHLADDAITPSVGGDFLKELAALSKGLNGHGNSKKFLVADHDRVGTQVELHLGGQGAGDCVSLSVAFAGERYTVQMDLAPLNPLPKVAHCLVPCRIEQLKIDRPLHPMVRCWHQALIVRDESQYSGPSQVPDRVPTLFNTDLLDQVQITESNQCIQEWKTLRTDRGFHGNPSNCSVASLPMAEFDA